jgi:hypothetical protein
VLKKIFGPKRDEVIGEWRTFHNQELYDAYCSPNQIKKNEIGVAYITYGGAKMCIQGFGGETLRKETASETCVD